MTDDLEPDDGELIDYSTFAEKPLTFPYQGKKYVLPELTIEAGLELAGVFTNKARAAKMQGVELWKLLLGPLWQQMIDDGVPLNFATRCGLTALADHQYGRARAKAAWVMGADPKRIAAYMNDQAKATGNRASRRSKSTAAATETPIRARTSGTNSRKR